MLGLTVHLLFLVHVCDMIFVTFDRILMTFYLFLMKSYLVVQMTFQGLQLLSLLWGK